MSLYSIVAREDTAPPVHLSLFHSNPHIESDVSSMITNPVIEQTGSDDIISSNPHSDDIITGNPHDIMQGAESHSDSLNDEFSFISQGKQESKSKSNKNDNINPGSDSITLTNLHIQKTSINTNPFTQHTESGRSSIRARSESSYNPFKPNSLINNNNNPFLRDSVSSNPFSPEDDIDDDSLYSGQSEIQTIVFDEVF